MTHKYEQIVHYKHISMTNVQLSPIDQNVQKLAEADATPNIEKKSMNPADISMTLRLPTRVKPSSPAFSLNAKEMKEK